MKTVYDWSGAIFGVIGAFLLATNTDVSKYGWIFFLVANVIMIALAVVVGLRGLLFQQVAFLGTSLLGIYRADLLPGFIASPIRTMVSGISHGIDAWIIPAFWTLVA